jgi:hypothetical protein
MNKLLTIISIIPFYCFGQTKTDYELYSRIILNEFQEKKMEIGFYQNIVIIDNLTETSKSLFEEFCQDFEYNFESMVQINRKDSIYYLTRNDEFKRLLNELCKEYAVINSFVDSKFLIKQKVTILEKEKVEKIFKTKNAKQIENSWKKFYKLYPESQGFYEFSKILYSENFALVYFVHKGNPLFGNGSIIIMKRNGQNFEIQEKLTLWNN